MYIIYSSGVVLQYYVCDCTVVPVHQSAWIVNGRVTGLVIYLFSIM